MLLALHSSIYDNVENAAGEELLLLLLLGGNVPRFIIGLPPIAGVLCSGSIELGAPDTLNKVE